jgi:ankyrin repeat protein
MSLDGEVYVNKPVEVDEEKMRDIKQNFPLIYAIITKESVAKIDELIKQSPKIIGEQCYGKLPIHIACGFDSDPEVISKLLLAYPHSIKIGDDGGQLPLHFAAKMSTKPDTIAVLLTAYPDSANVGNEWGETPLDYAIQYNIDPDQEYVIELL